jgi:alpha-galactosidase
LRDAGAVTAIDITADGAGLSFEPDRGGQLRQIGFRPRPDERQRIERGAFPPEAFPLAYPAWGQDVSAAPALRLTSHDGRQTCYPVFAGYEREGTEHRIRLTDDQARLTVDLAVRTHAGGVIEQWTEIRHDQPGPITLHEAAAAAPVLHAPEPWLTRFDGDWAAEWTASTTPVPIGGTVVESFGAVRPCLQASPFFVVAPHGPAAEDSGTALAGCLAWGGGIRLAFSRRVGLPDQLRVHCGHQPTGYVLDPGQVFRTPRMTWVWSSEGTRSLTHRLHRWVRATVVRDGDRIRPVVFNTWETTYFAFDQAKLAGLMAGAAGLGAELFLLDDGWFGTEFPRDDDTAGLGDWETDPAKLPDGLGGLTAAADQHGLRFGLWVEPEMVNPASRLYRSRPDWVVAEPGRPRREDRNQLVLDLCQPEVRSFVTGTIGRLLTDHAGISYLKWDANRDVSEPGSGGLPPDRQANVWIDTVLARWQVMAAVADRWPDTELMLCASGGGRTDLGTLCWFHEVWLSDNTDAVARLRMQWHASRFLPPQVLTAHVTRRGGQDVAFACAVAMSARFGFDLDPAGLTAAELAAARRATTLYREVRDLVQLGDLFRLIPPDEPDSDGQVALGFSDPAGHRAVVFGYQVAEPAADSATPPPTCPVPWARADVRYQVRRAELITTDEQVTELAGAELHASGLPWPLRAPRTAVIWLVTAEPSERSWWTAPRPDWPVG